MSIYRTCFGLAGALISLPGGLFLLAALSGLSPRPIMLFGGLLLGWWSAYYALRKGSMRAFVISYALALLLWVPLLIRTIRRVQFIKQNGGMEGPDGYGSPAAFLVNMTIEQMFFLPVTFVVVCGLIYMCHRYLTGARRESDASDPSFNSAE